jgi:acyl dehydratase
MSRSTPDSPFLDDFRVGDSFRSSLGRTLIEADNVWFTCLTMNTNQSHFNFEQARKSRFEKPLVNSTLTLALVTGLSVADTSEHAIANLGWSDVALPNPVYCGDTIWAETEILEVRESRSRPSVGVVEVRTRGVNQRGEVVIEFRRKFMVPKQGTNEAQLVFPEVTDDWRV